MCRPGYCRIDRLRIAETADKGDIVRLAGPHRRRPRRQRVGPVGHHRPLVDLHIDQRRRIGRQRRRFSDDDGHRLARITHAVAGQKRPRRPDAAAAVVARRIDFRHQIWNAVGIEIGGGEDGDDAGKRPRPGDVKRCDAAAGDHRPGKARMSQAEALVIGHERAVAGRQPLVFSTPGAVRDDGLAHVRSPIAAIGQWLMRPLAKAHSLTGYRPQP